jgi:hypothetical protein
MGMAVVISSCNAHNLQTDSGYYNPILAYGEEKAVRDARIAGANGFIVVDLPPEEAVKFREICAANMCVTLIAFGRTIFLIISQDIIRTFTRSFDVSTTD